MTPLSIAIPLFLLLACSIGLLVYWSVVWWKVVETGRELPTARAGLALAENTPHSGRVCVIVPAHNEETVIGRLVASLRKQSHPDLRVVLALDRCTDATAHTARESIGTDPRFEIIEIEDCPDGWAGKVNAVWTGVQRAEGVKDAAYLLFTDADCWFEPRAVEACVALLNERDLGLLSLFCTLTNDRWFELFAQPVAGFELARQYPPLRANERDAAQRRPFANGQFMLFRAEAYRAFGGHEAVHEALLEDIDLARMVAHKGYAGGMLMADGLVRCRMYDDWAQFKRGWKRIYTEAGNRRPRRMKAYGRRLRLMGVLLPLATIAAFVLGMFVTPGDQPLRGLALAVPIAGFVALLGAAASAHRASGAPAWTAITHPIGAWLVGGLLIDAARDIERGNPTEWGGKSYTRTER